MNGYLKIKTKIDNKDVDKGIVELENKIKKLQEDNLKQSQTENDLQAQINKYEEMHQKANEYHQKIKELKLEQKGMFSETGSLPASQLNEYQKISDKVKETEIEESKLAAEIDKQASKIENVYIKLSRVKDKQVENNVKIEEYKQKIEQVNMKNIQQGVDNVGKSITKQIGKLGKMAMAIAGIRTAYMGVRRIISAVSTYNSQISTDLEYMRYAISNMFAPAVQKLVKLLYTVLSYINAISSAWFGINLFSNSSAKNFQKMKQSASKTAKSAKEIQKSLQGFDEMNVLQDTNNSSNTSKDGGVAVPSVDLSGVQGEIPKWLQWIIDNKDIIIAALAGIAAGVLAIKFGLSGIKALGIGVLVAGIVKLIQDLQEYLKDPSWENFGKIISDIGLIILGLRIIIGNVPVIIAGAIALIIGIIVSNWDKIKEFLQNGIDWLTEKSDWVHNMFGDIVGRIYDSIVSALQLVLGVFDNVFRSIKGILDGLIMFITGVFSGDWKKAWEGIKKIFSSIWEGIKGVVVSVWKFIKGLVINIATSVGEIISGAFKAVVNAVLGAVESILNTPINAINGLIGVINSVPGINLTRLSTFNLPRLARGAVISQPTQAIIGEAGKEAVVPLENNMEWLDMLADKLTSKIGNNGGSYIINLDGRTIQRGIARKQQELAFATNGR